LLAINSQAPFHHQGQLNNLEMLDLFSNQLSGINQTMSMPRSLDYCEMEKNMFNAQFQAGHQQSVKQNAPNQNMLEIVIILLLKTAILELLFLLLHNRITSIRS
jgi:hypothetical protein